MRYLGIIGGGLVLACLTMPAWAVSCGETLTAGAHVMTADLDCPEGAGGVILQSGAKLDLGGFALRSYDVPAVTMLGKGAVVRNGAIGGKNQGRPGVFVSGEGQHRIEDLAIGAHDAALHVESGRNLIQRTILNTHSSEVALITGNGNMFRHNQVGSDYLWVSSQKNLIWRNAGTNELSTFIDAWGDCEHNHWVANRVANADPACILDGIFRLSQIQD